MGAEIIGLIIALLGLIPVILNARKNSHANRNTLGQVESAELRTGMDRIKQLHP